LIISNCSLFFKIFIKNHHSVKYLIVTQKLFDIEIQTAALEL
jgi:hypothetical protein